MRNLLCTYKQVNRWMMLFLKTDVHQRQEALWCPSTSVVCLQQRPGIRSRHQNCCSLRIAALLAHALAPLLRSRRGSNVANRESNFSPSLDQDVPASQFGTSWTLVSFCAWQYLIVSCAVIPEESAPSDSQAAEMLKQTRAGQPRGVTARTVIFKRFTLAERWFHRFVAQSGRVSS